MGILNKLTASSGVAGLREEITKYVHKLFNGFPRAPKKYAAQKGRYVLWKVSKDGKTAIYRHPTKRGAGRTLTVKS